MCSDANRRIDFANIAILERWLHAHNVKITHWGQASAKSVADLWQELARGESRLQDDPPSRLVDVTSIHVYQDDHMLVEVAQELGSGRMRRRNSPPAEKMLPGESALDAARRCLHEELHLTEAAFLSRPRFSIHKFARLIRHPIRACSLASPFTR